MKYLVLLVVLLVIYMLWRSKRSRDLPLAGRDQKAEQPPALPQDMVRCPVCALHLPRAEALPGPGGALYCSAEHLRRADDAA